MTLSSSQQAQARQHTYTLFSQLYLHGITADLLAFLQTIPELAAALPEPFDPDEAAAVHQKIFGFNVFPNAAIFLDDSRLLGGRIANQHAAIYQQNNFDPNSAVDPDHISQSLAFLAKLSVVEADNLMSGKSPTASRSQQYYFFENHLLPWLIPLTIAIQQQADPFYSELAQLTLDLVADNYSSNDVLQFASLNQASIQPDTLSDPPSLEDGRTGLREIARYLVTPVLSGLYLGRSDINRLARRLNLPHGFGSRDQMLQTLFQSAGQYDSTSQLFAALNKVLATWKQAYEQIAHEYPKLSHHIYRWQSSLDKSRQILAQMEEQLGL